MVGVILIEHAILVQPRLEGGHINLGSVLLLLQNPVCRFLITRQNLIVVGLFANKVKSTSAGLRLLCTRVHSSALVHLGACVRTCVH